MSPADADMARGTCSARARRTEALAGRPEALAGRPEALAVVAWGAAAGAVDATPLAQATSERLALTVAALIAVAVLAVLGGLLILFFRREGQAQQGRAAGEAGAADRSLWVAGSGHDAGRANGAVRDLEDDPGDAGLREDREPGDAGEPGARAGTDADEPDDDLPARAVPPASQEPVVRPPAPQEAWTAEIVWAADVTRFRVVARREDETEDAPLALAQTEPLPWPPRDQASIRALTDASATLEHVLLDSGWSALPTGEAWYSKRFAWEPHVAGADNPTGSGRFERRPVEEPDAEPRAR